MKRSFALSLFVIIALTAPAHAQWSIEVGGGYVTERDTFTAPCGCHFADGTGYALQASVSYDIMSLFGLTVGSKLGADYTSFNSAHYYGTVRDSGHFELTYANIAPYVRYKVPLLGIFVQAEPSFGYLVNSYMYQRWHDTSGKLWGNGSVDTIQEDNAIPNPTKLKLDARLSLGSSFGLFGVQIAPMFTLAYPLTENESSNRSGQARSNWSLVTYWGSVAVRFKL